jgi:hypothetical protein
MLGLVISFVAAAVLPGAAATCAEGADSCELAAAAVVAHEDGHEDGREDGHEDGHEERTYATPAVIDCGSPAVPMVLSTLVGECDGTPYDASYWVSRDPQSERATPALAPAARERRAGVATSKWDGLPQKAPGLTISDVQPIALFATPAIMPAATDARAPRDTFSLPSRFGDPPDRPPRV